MTVAVRLGDTAAESLSCKPRDMRKGAFCALEPVVGLASCKGSAKHSALATSPWASSMPTQARGRVLAVLQVP
jgi:hypothetical protein